MDNIHNFDKHDTMILMTTTMMLKKKTPVKVTDILQSGSCSAECQQSKACVLLSSHQDPVLERQTTLAAVPLPGSGMFALRIMAAC